jgi:hypothetical protein
VPFSGDRAYIAFVNHGGGQRKFTRQGSAQPLEKARSGQGNGDYIVDEPRNGANIAGSCDSHLGANRHVK